MAKRSEDDRMRAKVRKSLDSSLRKAGYDPRLVVQEPEATITEHDRYARERLFYRDHDPLVRVPGE